MPFNLYKTALIAILQAITKFRTAGQTCRKVDLGAPLYTSGVTEITRLMTPSLDGHERYSRKKKPAN